MLGCVIRESCEVAARTFLWFLVPQFKWSRVTFPLRLCGGQRAGRRGSLGFNDAIMCPPLTINKQRSYFHKLNQT